MERYYNIFFNKILPIIFFASVLLFMIAIITAHIYSYNYYIGQNEVIEQPQTPELILEPIVLDTVTATVYNAVPEQTNSDPSHTATMFKLDLSNPEKHRIIAVSRDLEENFPMGSTVIIEGTDRDGEYHVQDRMNKRYKKRIDLLLNEDTRLGLWENVTIKLK